MKNYSFSKAKLLKYDELSEYIWNENNYLSESFWIEDFFNGEGFAADKIQTPLLTYKLVQFMLFDIFRKLNRAFPVHEIT